MKRSEPEDECRSGSRLSTTSPDREETRRKRGVVRTSAATSDHHLKRNMDEGNATWEGSRERWMQRGRDGRTPNNAPQARHVSTASARRRG